MFLRGRAVRGEGWRGGGVFKGSDVTASCTQGLFWKLQLFKEFIQSVLRKFDFFPNIVYR